MTWNMSHTIFGWQKLLFKIYVKSFSCTISNGDSQMPLLWFFLRGGGSVHRLESDKSWSFAITEFSNCFIIWSPCISSGSEAICHFHAKRKAWVLLCMSTILFAAKRQSETQLDNIVHEQTIINFVGSYLQVMWRAFGQWKERKICFKWY